MKLQIGMLLFPDLTQLDLAGPYEVFASLPESRTHLLAESLEPVRTEHGLTLEPTLRLKECPQLDVLFVPGGLGVKHVIQSRPCLEFLVGQAQKAKYITSVCTGALVLGAAGLLKGYRATTHWLSLDLLPLFGAIPVQDRIVVDRNRITGGGVTAGIDFALYLASRLSGESVAKQIQLLLEYDPAPPFDSGSPRTAAPDVIAHVRALRSEIQREREQLLLKAIVQAGAD